MKCAGSIEHSYYKPKVTALVKSFSMGSSMFLPASAEQTSAHINKSDGGGGKKYILRASFFVCVRRVVSFYDYDVIVLLLSFFLLLLLLLL